MKRDITYQTGFRRSRACMTGACVVVGLALLGRFAPVQAQSAPHPQSFLTLASGYTQELIATTPLGILPQSTLPKELGGVAFAPNGDVWSPECLDKDSTLHRFAAAQLQNPVVHATPTIRQELPPVATEAGCGIVNHPDGTMYSNTSEGVTRLSASTGLPVAWPDGSTGPKGAPGNALGIATRPATGHLVYPGANCDSRTLPGEPASNTCTLWELDPGTGADAPSVLPFAEFDHDDMPYVDGIYFEPSGDYLFVTNRADQIYDAPSGIPGLPTEVEINYLTVLRHPSLVTATTPQLVRNIPVQREPDGIAFHSSGHYLVTNDEEGGTMTRFDFPQGFDNPPANPQSVTVYDANGDEIQIEVFGVPIAQQGFRGDLVQVGADGCIYATQGIDPGGPFVGARYDDGTETDENSIVRLCTTDGEFEPPPGVRDPLAQGSVAGSAYLDVNGNNSIDEGIDSLLQGVTITLNGGPTPLTANTTNGPVPAYSFTELNAGSYTVSAPATSGGYARVSPESLTATITAAGENVTGLNFLYKPGRMRGSVFLDADDSLSISVGDTLLSGVGVSLSNGAFTLSGSGPVPTFTFPGLEAGSYTVTAPAIASGYLQTIAPATQTLSEGQSIDSLDFLYVRGKLSGFAYVDANGNSLMDTGEARLANVTVTGPGGVTRQTDMSGFYEFKGLAAGDYLLSAPLAVGTYTRSTSGSLPASLTAGGNIPNLNFGYVPPPPPPPPTGSISGKAYIDTNGNSVYDAGEVILAGVSVSLSTSAGAASGSASTTPPAGYSFTNLVAGGYNVSAVSTALYNGFTYNLTTPSPIAVTLAAGENRQHVNFGYRAAIVYTTYTQGGWGASPAGNNPGTLLQNNWAAVYGPTGGVTIGQPGVSGRYHLKFTSSIAIRNFLPAGGAPKALKASATNPTTSAAGVLAGQLLAARLSVDFSNARITTFGLGTLRVAPGYPLAGYTVNQVLTAADQAIAGGGLPSGVSFSTLNDVLTRINENFDNGTSNNGFLVP